jgi:hypothetical protein
MASKSMMPHQQIHIFSMHVNKQRHNAMPQLPDLVKIVINLAKWILYALTAKPCTGLKSVSASLQLLGQNLGGAADQAKYR